MVVLVKFHTIFFVLVKLVSVFLKPTPGCILVIFQLVSAFLKQVLGFVEPISGFLKLVPVIRGGPTVRVLKIQDIDWGKLYGVQTFQSNVTK